MATLCTANNPPSKDLNVVESESDNKIWKVNMELKVKVVKIIALVCTAQCVVCKVYFSAQPNNFKLILKGLTLVQALRSRVGAKGYWRHFFKNPTTQLHVVWGLTEKKCEQTPKFACFSVQRRPLHLSQAEMLPSHAVLKEGIKWRRPPPNRKWHRA